MVLFATYAIFNDPKVETIFNAVATGIASLGFVVVGSAAMGIAQGREERLRTLPSFLYLGDQNYVGAYARERGISHAWFCGEACRDAAAAYGEGARWFPDAAAAAAEVSAAVTRYSER